MKNNIDNILIYGNGSFGRLLSKILEENKTSFQIVNPLKYKDLTKHRVVIMAIPAQYIKENLKKIHPNALIIDVASVKEYPKEIYIKNNRKAILTHPMFGPNSYKEMGLKNQKIMTDYSLINNQTKKEFKNYIKLLELKEMEMSSSDHDKITAKTLVLHHIIGRIVPELFEEELDTLNYKKIKEIYDSVKSDSDDLFKSLMKYNRYSKNLLKEISNKIKDIELDP